MKEIDFMAIAEAMSDDYKAMLHREYVRSMPYGRDYPMERVACDAVALIKDILKYKWEEPLTHSDRKDLRAAIATLQNISGE